MTDIRNDHHLFIAGCLRAMRELTDAEIVRFITEIREMDAETQACCSDLLEAAHTVLGERVALEVVLEDLDAAYDPLNDFNNVASRDHY
jgi:hypothetical protein